MNTNRTQSEREWRDQAKARGAEARSGEGLTMKTFTVIVDVRTPTGTMRAVVINAIPAHSQDEALIQAHHRILEMGATPIALRKVRRTDIGA